MEKESVHTACFDNLQAWTLLIRDSYNASDSKVGELLSDMPSLELLQTKNKERPLVSVLRLGGQILDVDTGGCAGDIGDVDGLVGQTCRGRDALDIVRVVVRRISFLCHG